ncbi:uncharacterized protein LOC144447856 [Glandiceps talaboti]
MTTIFGSDGSESLETSASVWMNISSSNQSKWAEITAQYYTSMGYTLYSLFGIIALVMLLNLCIAMMSDRYTKIMENIDTVWKFERSKIWMEYIGAEGSNFSAISCVFYLTTAILCSCFRALLACCTWCTCHSFIQRCLGQDEPIMPSTREVEMGNVQDEPITVKVKRLKYRQLLRVLLKRYCDRFVRSL